jgi:hypothetical protein
MKGLSRILLLMAVIALLVPFTSAAGPFIANTSNTSVQQMGGLFNSYTFVNGDDTFEVFTAVPLTVQDNVYPLEFWYASWYLSWLCLILGILMTVFRDRVPSIAIMAFGILAFGGFLICALMLPYTASMLIDVQVIQNVDKMGVSLGNNSVYITQVADYRASTPHAWICWGLSVAGFVELVLGVLSLLGWLKLEGIGRAQRGEYLETDGEPVDENEYRFANQTKPRSKR